MSKAQVFVPDDKHVWLQAEVIEDDVTNKVIIVRITDPCYNGSVDRSLSYSQFPDGASSLLLQNDCLDMEGVYDMCNLTHLHEPGILDNLRRRFGAKMPYTYTNEMCIAVNPYQWLNIYTDKLRDQYMHQSREDLMPHIYATSAAAFRGLCNPIASSSELTSVDIAKLRRNQSVIVSGESGAGKTESVKLLMDHIANMSQRANDDMIDKVLKSNPLLESFGNAKTCRNDNSSRFGKFIQLQFNESVQLIGSKCSTYLLEKSRVVMQSSVERNYHIFYQLLSAPEDIKSRLHLANKTVHNFKYTALGDAQTQEIEGRSDSERYHSTMNGLREDFSLGEGLLEEVHCILSGILHLGEVHSGTVSGGDNNGSDAPVATSSDVVKQCCSLFKVDPAIFLRELTSRYIDVEGSRVSVPLTAAQAVLARDALAKEVYSRLFNWLVVVINHNTTARNDQQQQTATQSAEGVSGSVTITLPSCLGAASAVSSVANTISLLDIFGFECFDGDNNRFEQLCINLANEKLQQLFASDMIRSVQQEYLAEGITTLQSAACQQMLSEDNAGIIEMIEGRQRGSLISALNEECLIPQGSDTSFLNKIKTLLKGHPNFSNEIVGNNTSAGGRVASGALNQSNSFTVSHYAGKVTYCVVGFMERNRDSLLGHLVEFMSSSGNSLLACLFQNSMLYGTNASSGGTCASAGADTPSLKRAQSSNAVLPSHGNSNKTETGAASSLKKGKSCFFPAASSEEDSAIPLTELLPSPPSHPSDSYLFTNAYLTEVLTMEPSPYQPSDDGSSSVTSHTSASVATPVKGGGGGRLTPPRRASFMLAETITSKFRSELSSLIATIAATRVHYVRCIKPNAIKSCTEFDRQLVVAQLRSAGMIDAVRIARASYPVRMSHKEFVFKYSCLSKTVQDSKTLSDVEKCQLIAISVNTHGSGSVKYDLKPFEVGLTRIYLTSPLLASLNLLRSQHCHRCATRIQSQVRRWAAECHLHASKVRIMLIQKFIRRMLAVVRYRYKRCCIVLLQQCARRLLAQIQVQRRRECVRVTTIQSIYRGFLQKRWFKSVLDKVRLIQSMVRMRIKRSRYIVMRDKFRFDQNLLLQLSVLKSTVETVQRENEVQTDRIAALVIELQEERARRGTAEMALSALRTREQQQLQQLDRGAELVKRREEQCACLTKQLQESQAECARQRARADALKSNLGRATDALVQELQHQKLERDTLEMELAVSREQQSEVEQLLTVQSSLVNRKQHKSADDSSISEVNVVSPSVSPIVMDGTEDMGDGGGVNSVGPSPEKGSAASSGWTLLDEDIRKDISKLKFDAEKLIIVALLLLVYILLL